MINYELTYNDKYSFNKVCFSLENSISVPHKWEQCKSSLSVLNPFNPTWHVFGVFLIPIKGVHMLQLYGIYVNYLLLG